MPLEPLLDRIKTRREFLVGTGALFGAATVSNAADLGRARSISIFHTTDLHGRIVPTSTYEGLDDVGGFARCATCIRQWRQESPHSITVDVGDVMQGTAVSLASSGNLMIELLNSLSYDAWTLGNHDFDWGPENLEANLKLFKAPIVTANLNRGATVSGQFGGAWENVKPWTMREVGGFRIAIIGLVTPGIPYWLATETLGGVAVSDPAESLARCVLEAKTAQADAIVVTGHMGWRFQDDYANPLRSLLRDANDVDIYLAGHSHQNQPSWSLHKVLGSQASYYGIHCGRVDLTFDLDTRKLIDRRAFTILMDDRFALDPAVMARARPDLAKADEQLVRSVGTVAEKIPGNGRNCRLVQLLCESFSEALARNNTPVDGVFHGSFNSGDLLPGKLTVADCWRMIPYENRLATAEVSAEDLITIVREDAGDKKSDRTLWPFEVVLNAEGQAARFMLKGQPVAPDRRFTIGFNSYDAQSGGRRLMQLREIVSRPSAQRVTTSIDTRSALMEGLLNRRQIA